MMVGAVNLEFICLEALMMRSASSFDIPLRTVRSLSLDIQVIDRSSECRGFPSTTRITTIDVPVPSSRGLAFPCSSLCLGFLGHLPLVLLQQRGAATLFQLFHLLPHGAICFWIGAWHDRFVHTRLARPDNRRIGDRASSRRILFANVPEQLPVIIKSSSR